MANLQFRGVSYDSSSHEQLSSSPVEHTYRGQRFLAPLRHEQVVSPRTMTLLYRGHAYQRRVTSAASELESN